jgi:hypothetical protein
LGRQRLNDAAAGAEAKAREYENQIASLRQGRASCEEFFDGWGIEASPPGIVKLFGIAREATAARDCINKGDATTACRHWEGLLVEIKKIGSPVSESQIEIEKLMRQHNCKKFKASDANGSTLKLREKPGQVRFGPKTVLWGDLLRLKSFGQPDSGIDAI